MAQGAPQGGGGGGGVTSVNGDAGPIVVLDATDVGAGQIDTGTYTGDGTESQAITGIGFQPKYVRVWERRILTGLAVDVYETTDTIIVDNANGMSINNSNSKTRTNAIISLDADGFTVDDDAGPSGGDHPNKLGTIYNYMAMG
jgi:hypothetical protein